MAGAEPGWIVVFGFPPRADGTPSPELARRIAAAALAARRHPAARLLLSGGAAAGRPAEAAVMAARLVGHGIAADRIVEDRAARDTLATVRAAARIVPPRAPVLAVTSPYHLPRCLLLLRLAGLRPRGLAARAGRRIGLGHRLYWTLREIPAFAWDALVGLAVRLRGGFGRR